MAGAGADVVLLGHGGDFGPVQEEIRQHGRVSHVVEVDLSAPREVAAQAAEILHAHRIDILVNNAGIIRRSDAHGHSFDDWRAVMSVNLDSIFELTKTIAGPMLPGYFATDNTEALRADEQRNSEILSRIPVGRWGTPEDLAGAAVFLARPAYDYVTGHVLAVDGGWLAR